MFHLFIRKFCVGKIVNKIVKIPRPRKKTMPAYFGPVEWNLKFEKPTVVNTKCFVDLEGEDLNLGPSDEADKEKSYKNPEYYSYHPMSFYDMLNDHNPLPQPDPYEEENKKKEYYENLYLNSKVIHEERQCEESKIDFDCIKSVAPQKIINVESDFSAIVYKIPIIPSFENIQKDDTFEPELNPNLVMTEDNHFVVKPSKRSRIKSLSKPKINK